MVIHYDAGYYQLKAILQVHGSVLPRACTVSIWPALIAVALGLYVKFKIKEDGEEFTVLFNSGAYTSFTFVVGFLLVFRNQTAYARFWEGTTLLQVLRGQWVGAFGSLIAFSTGSKSSEEEITLFRMKLIRMFSCLHACALDYIYDCDDGTTRIIGIDGLEDTTLRLLSTANDESLIYVIVQWIQQMILHNMQQGVITAQPPIVSRVFQDLSLGVVTVNNSKKISDTPFPFPYCQSLQIVLLVHLLLTPVIFVQWVNNPLLAGLFTFVAVALFQTLNFISAEIEHPYGTDPNDVCREKLQEKFNTILVTMLSPGASQRPQLRQGTANDPSLYSRIDQLPRYLFPETEEEKLHYASYSEAWERMRPDKEFQVQATLSEKRENHSSDKSIKALFLLETKAREPALAQSSTDLNSKVGTPPENKLVTKVAVSPPAAEAKVIGSPVEAKPVEATPAEEKAALLKPPGEALDRSSILEDNSVAGSGSEAEGAPDSSGAEKKKKKKSTKKKSTLPDAPPTQEE